MGKSTTSNATRRGGTIALPGRSGTQCEQWTRSGVHGPMKKKTEESLISTVTAEFHERDAVGESAHWEMQANYARIHLGKSKEILFLIVTEVRSRTAAHIGKRTVSSRDNRVRNLDKRLNPHAAPKRSMRVSFTCGSRYIYLRLYISGANRIPAPAQLVA